MAPKSAEKKKATPKQKSPAKKAKTEEEEVPPAGEQEEQEAAEEPAAAEEHEAEEPAAEEAGAAAAAAQGPAPAAHTRSKEGGASGPSPAKKMATSAAENQLPPVTISDILLADHRDTVALLKHHQDVAGGGDKLLLEKLTDTIAITIRLHSQAEMEVLYPMAEKKLGAKGKEAAAHAAGEHAKIERDLTTALEKRKTGGEELAQTIQEVTEAFLHHLKEEEEQMMPDLIKKCTEEELEELAVSFMEAKAKAPLQPQPEAAEAAAEGEVEAAA